MNTPLVSVLMAAYNSEKYIGEAIASVLASGYKNFELIICDDRSTDRTPEIAREFAMKDERVKLYLNEENLGDYPNRNKAASYATGKYLKYLDHDDTIYPWGLEAMVTGMEKFPEAGFGIVSSGIPQPTSYPILVSPAEAYRHYFFKGSLFGIGPTGAIIRKTAFEAVNGFSGKPFAGDQEIWLKMARSFSVVRLPWDLIWYRKHDAQESKRETKDDLSSIRRYLIVKEALNDPNCPLTEAERKILLRNYNNIAIRTVIKNNIIGLRLNEIKRTFNLCGFDFSDLVKALRKNRVPGI
ncbi:MAG: glycosyltransferase family A protein [Ferruginibacter sp.]